MADKPKILALPLYILVDEATKVLPSVEVKIIRPSELPDKGNYYVCTAEGWNISKDTDLIKGLVPLKDEGDNLTRSLATLERTGKLRLPKIPSIIIARAWSFFARVYEKHHSESEVMLLYNKATREYDLWCPEQEVSFGSVDYTMSTQLQAMQQELRDKGESWQWVGTIHSHCNFSAYHSGTDIDDEKNSDGIHVTIGHVDRKACSMAASAVIGKVRWKMGIQDVTVGVEPAAEDSSKKQYYMAYKDPDDFFQIALSDEETALLEGIYEKQISKQWMPRVSKATFKGGSWEYGGGNYSSYKSPNDVVWEETDYVEPDDDDGGEWRLVSGSWKFIKNEDLTASGEDASSEIQHDPSLWENKTDDSER